MIRKIINKIRKRHEFRQNFAQQIASNRNRQVQFFNFWDQPFDNMFWNFFFTTRPYLLKGRPDLKIGFFSVFGSRELVRHTGCDINIFYTAENVRGRFDYADYFLTERKIDLSMGFEYFGHEKYIRFPNWMDVFFQRMEDIKTICHRLRYPEIGDKTLFASCICSHDKLKGTEGLRASIIDALNEIDIVSCPARFRHNDDSLLNDYADDKLEYLKQFQFNICPENSNCMGYVTEKIFHAISSGCIPIYWGSYNRPELDVLNQDAIIFWNKDGNNTDALRLISDLHKSPKLMKDFLGQPRLISTAEEYISTAFSNIERKINLIINNL
ncbi:MAG: glycosyltransferase family 10 domain-containing protein [Mangrovibacterium sp.]